MGTPFLREIDQAQMPQRYSVPQIYVYDELSNPNLYVDLYKQHMLTLNTPGITKEAYMCKGFGAIVVGPILQ